MVSTGSANVENEPNPPFDVTEREQFRQFDVCGHRARSLSSQERLNVREEAQQYLEDRMIMNRRRQHRNHLIIMTRNRRSGNG
jgi:hypothetical protein